MRSGWDPQDPRSNCLRALLRVAKEDWDAAPADFEAAPGRMLSDFNEANRLDRMNSQRFADRVADAIDGRGNAHLAKSWYKPAIADFTEVIRLAPRA